MREDQGLVSLSREVREAVQVVSYVEDGKSQFLIPEVPLKVG